VECELQNRMIEAEQLKMRGTGNLATSLDPAARGLSPNSGEHSFSFMGLLTLFP
jgi:hypothetical protein